MTVTVRHGDCIEVMRGMEPRSIDSIVTDPPYGLGFMGKAWDALPPGKEWAEECLRVLKPGGHLLAFGGTRTWHRLAVAIEDAGFEMRDSIAWLHSEGFPKHRATLKPAFEPIVMARKPFKGSLTANEAVYGTGALNIDASRIGGTQGRWPANAILDEMQGEALDQQSGNRPGYRSQRHLSASKHGMFSVGGGVDLQPESSGFNDEGGASRFFKVAAADEDGAISPYFPREFDSPFKYAAKAPKSERPVVDGVAHPTVKPLTLMRYLVKLVTPPGGVVLDPFAGSGTTLEAATLEGFRSIGVEAEAAYLPLIEQRFGSVA